MKKYTIRWFLWRPNWFITNFAVITNVVIKVGSLYISWIESETDAFPCHINVSVPSWVMDHDGRATREKDAQAFEMKINEHLIAKAMG